MSRRTVTYKQGEKDNYDKTVKKVIIDADVTEIVEKASDDCENLASMELGLGCKKI